jgi:transketolase
MVNKGKASHIASAFSMVEILNAIYKSVDIQKIINKDKERDRVILSKGHGTSGLYAVMFHHGLVSKKAIDYVRSGKPAFIKKFFDFKIIKVARFSTNHVSVIFS